jgi:branched-chain amino acid aminotransferase
VPNNLYRNINGLLHAAAVPGRNGAIRHHAFGLFETILVQDGRILLASEHWARLLAGLSLLSFDLTAGFDAAFLQLEAERLISAAPYSSFGRLRVQVFTASPQSPYLPLFQMEYQELDAQVTAFNSVGLHAEILPDYRKNMDWQSKLKLSHNDYAAPAQIALKALQCDEVLLLNQAGNIAETAIANLFYVQQGSIYTPPLSEGCLEGIMRQWWLQRLAKAGIPVTEKVLSPAMLPQVDELFVTNSLRPLRWIGRAGAFSFRSELVSTLQSLGMDLYK